MNLFDYPYLVTSLVLLTIAMTGYCVLRTRRRTLFVSGLLSMPCSLTTFYFVPEYWQPVRLFDFLLGIEDIFFSFSTGMLVWFLMEVRPGDAVSETGWSRVLPRYFKVLSLGLATILLMQQIPIMVMNQALVGIIIIGLILSWNRWRALPSALLTGVAFSSFYTLLLAFMFANFPKFSIQWTHSNLFGLSVLGIPVEESIWAFIFGVCWVIVMVFVFNTKIPVSSDQETNFPN
jgi:hypothetical protein